MIDAKSIILKCSSLSFCELKALKELTNEMYKGMMDKRSGEELMGLVEEIQMINSSIDKVISNKIINFLSIAE